MDLISALIIVVLIVGAILLLGIVSMLPKCYQKVQQGKAIVRTGLGGTKVAFSGILVFPIVHRMEIMDISVKRVEIHREGKDGLICKDNMRADIRVAFFVRVNKTAEDVLKVAQSLGCDRASQVGALVEFFDAKFSEGLKTVGKRFDFTELYASRVEFKEEILQIIGTDLNGYILDDAAIDYLEQTPLETLNPNNILDAEGIKKITDLTAKQLVLANKITRDKEKTITQQDVEAKEAILELNRQLAESEEKQKREVLNIKAREQAEVVRVQQEEKLKAERARIATDEEVGIAEEQKQRQIIVAQKNKERTEKIEIERVEKDRALEAVERERVTEIARIEKEKALEQEKRLIQDVIRERVVVEKATVAEEEKIKDTRAFATADREKQVKLVEAERIAQEALVKEVRAAEARRQAADHHAQEVLIEAEAEKEAAARKGEAMKTLAEARAAEEAVIGMSEVNVMTARANAIELEGVAQAKVLEQKAIAEARGIEAKAAAKQKEGAAEASVLAAKFQAEAKGIEQKADAMRKLDGVGKEHEEFKLRLDKEKAVELAQIHIEKDIAEAQASVIRDGLKSAKIEIIGGESIFFDRLAGAITTGRSIDRAVNNSKVLTEVKDTFFNGDPEHFRDELKKYIGYFGVTSEDVKNLSVAALVTNMIDGTNDPSIKGRLQQFLTMARKAGVEGKPAATFM